MGEDNAWCRDAPSLSPRPVLGVWDCVYVIHEVCIDTADQAGMDEMAHLPILLLPVSGHIVVVHDKDDPWFQIKEDQALWHSAAGRAIIHAIALEADDC